MTIHQIEHHNPELFEGQFFQAIMKNKEHGIVFNIIETM